MSRIPALRHRSPSGRRWFAAWIIASVLAGLALAQEAGQPRPRRAAPPKFDPAVTGGIFFRDVFKEGLVGERPSDLGAAPSTSVAGSSGGGSTSGGEAPPPSTSGAGWARLISAVVVEDEIKAIKQLVDQDVTTPTKFAGGGYEECRRHFTMAALLFAVAAEYEGDVRWRDVAPAARDVFARSAGNCKVGSVQAFNEAKLRKQDLEDLVGGGAFAGEANPGELDWGVLADRSPLMQRLELGCDGKLAGWTASEGEFKGNLEAVQHEAALVAVIAETLLREGMPEADDETYAGFARQMRDAAVQVQEAVRDNKYDQARQAVGAISQACSQCHDQYR